MEIECSKCQRKFASTKSDATVCPDCLKDEFAAVAPRLDAQEHAKLVAEYAPSMKRQSARAAAMGGMYASGQAFSMAGTLRLLLGLVFFLVCGFFFLVSDDEAGVTFLANGDMASQRLFAMVFCVVSATLVATSAIRYKKVMYFLAVLILVTGWFMPNMLKAALNEKAKARAASEKHVEVIQDPELSPGGPVLTDADLQVFYTLKVSSNRVAHYAIFIDNQDSRTRSIVREALNRLLQAEYTRAHTRANGALYVCTNVPGARRNISDILTRFGTVTYAAPTKGVYEVRFDADHANMVSQYSPDVLASPMNASYVAANLSELRCLDPLRVRMSARSLANSNVKVLRGEIRNALVEVLNDPWTSEPDTYSALVEALVVYSQGKDDAALQHCYRYFEARRMLKREVSPNVTRYLIMKMPEKMVNPIVEFWCENPIAWKEMLNLLGFRVQAPLVDRLGRTNNIRLIGSILKFLEEKGTKDALPAVEAFLDYPDSIIRHSARTTYDALKAR